MMLRLGIVLGRIRAWGLPYIWARLRLRLAGREQLRDYATWIMLFDTPRPRQIARAVQKLAHRSRFSILLARWDAETVASVCEQPYPDWELLVNAAIVGPTHARIRAMPVPGDAPSVEAALLAHATGEFIIPLVAGDRISPAALWQIARVAAAPVDLIYSDEDSLIDGQRRAPVFKPQYSAELLYDPAGIGGLVAWRRGAERFRPEAGVLAIYDIVLQVAERARAIRHIPYILLHRGSPPPNDMDMWARLLNEHLARIGDDACAVPTTSHRVVVQRPLPTPAPKVTVIIPTRDQAALLERCIDGVLRATDYPDLEVIIVDNDSAEPAATQLLDRLRQGDNVRVLHAPGPFNYAAMNNRAAEQAQGSILALLNNDIAVREPGWLRAMVALAVRPDIGAVGAKLLYPNGTIQHAGVVTGFGGLAAHLYRGQPDTQPLRLREVSAVTAACMVLRRDVFLSVGGFDAVELPISFNDIDLCLRLRARGLRILFAPDAVLDHHESISRGQDSQPEHVARALREGATLRRRWASTLDADPFYNPNLPLDTERSVFAFPPRTRNPHRAQGT